MDRSEQMEDIQKELVSIKKDNPQAVASAKTQVKAYIGEHPEIGEDENLVLLMVYASCKMGKEKLDDIVSKHFKPYQGGLTKILEGTKRDPKASLNFLFSKLKANVERVLLAHKVYVLSRSTIRKDVVFPSDDVDEDTGEKPKHTTFSVTLWDNDGKQIIPLFLVDEQVEPHAKLEAGKAYRMQIGNYNAEKDRWYASKDPSIVPLNGDAFSPDWNALAQYVLHSYAQIREPYDEIIAGEKEHPNRRYAMLAGYAKKPSYIELTPYEETSYVIAVPHSSATQTLDDEGELVVVGKFQKSKPKEGNPKTSDYVIFPELVINLTSGSEGVSTNTDEGDATEDEARAPKTSQEKGKKKSELDKLLD